MLRTVLEVLDKYEVFDQSTGLQPVLLLDGHQSRMKLHFLKYINHPSHLWVVCLVVPNGTHNGKVGDALQLNGCFKMALAKSKRKILSFQDTENKKFVRFMSYYWSIWHGKEVLLVAHLQTRQSFKKVWSPLNYVLLDNTKLHCVDKET
jgi:hypothetical protein